MRTAIVWAMNILLAFVLCRDVRAEAGMPSLPGLSDRNINDSVLAAYRAGPGQVINGGCLRLIGQVINETTIVCSFAVASYAYSSIEIPGGSELAVGASSKTEYSHVGTVQYPAVLQFPGENGFRITIMLTVWFKCLPLKVPERSAKSNKGTYAYRCSL